MNCAERRQKLAEYNAELESVFDPTSFVLNPAIEELQTKISLLKQGCIDHFCAECITCKLGGNK